MFAIVPDKVLENSVCSNCGKYLSVLPVTISKNYKKICGRCVGVEVGVQSAYNKLAEEMLFKCVNCYEGCRKLLLPNQVVEHEEPCKSNKYECPLCANVWIPSYAMKQHFGEHHSGLVITNPSFTINKTVDTFKTLMYYTDKHIFFIHVSLDVDNELSLRADCLGPTELSKNIKYGFCFTRGNHIKTGFRSFNSGEQKICSQDLKPSEKCELILNYDAENFLDFVQIGKVDIQKNSISNINRQNVAENRTIYLDENFLIKNNEWKLSGCKTLLINKNNPDIEIDSICSSCGYLIYENNVYGCYCLGIHLVCYRCKDSRGPGQYKYISMYNSVFKFKLFCKWKCQQSFFPSQLYKHERICSQRGPITCGICGKSDIPNIDALKNHFSVHGSTLYILNDNYIYIHYLNDKNKNADYYNIGPKDNNKNIYFYMDDIQEYFIITASVFMYKAECTLRKTNFTNIEFITEICNQKVVGAPFDLFYDRPVKILIKKVHNRNKHA